MSLIKICIRQFYNLAAEKCQRNKFGTAMNPLKVSAMSQTISSEVTHPTNIIPTK